MARARRRSNARLNRLGVPAVLYLAACGLFVWVRHRNRFFEGAVIVAIAGIGIWLTHMIRIEVRDKKPPRLVAVLLLGAPFVIGGILLAFWLVADWTEGWGFFGAALFYLGLGLIVSRFRHSKTVARPIGIGFACLAAGLLLAGVGVLAAGDGRGALLLAAALVLFGPLAFSLLSADANRRLQDEEDPGRALLYTVGGGVLVIGALLAIAVFDNFLTLGPGDLVVIGIVVLLLMLAVAARSNADAIVAVAAFAAVVATAQQRVDVPESARADEGERVFAALGDSFMSGEGADVYFKGTNTRRVNECRRAPSAYAAKLAAESGGTVPTDVIFIACSGAKARHIYVDAQHPGEPVDGPEGGLPQLANLDHQLSTAELDKGHVALVLLSIGGNDSLFGDIAQTCVRPGNCAELGQAWLTNLARVRGILLDTYDAVHLAFRDTPVVVVPYPIPIDRDMVCTYSTFTPEEHRFLHGFTEQLNSVIRAAAAERKFHVLEEMELALDRDQLCDGGEDEVGVNFVAANGVDGLFEQQADPRNWFHNSMHPNERGHELMTAVAREWIAANPDLPSRADTATPPSVAPPTDVGDECVDADDLDDCAAMWTAGELARYLTFPGVLWVALVIGAWLVELAFIRWWRRELQRWFTERFGPRWRSVRQAVGVTVQD